MRRKPVQSSSMRSVGYDPQLAVLEIEFDDGAIYQYRTVAVDMHAALMSAESKGRFFQRYIRDQYQTEWIRS